MKRANFSKSREFVQWATHATKGVDESGMMLALVDESGTKGAKLEFALQIGHCLLEDKPLIIILPTGTPLPAKLEAAATVVEYYDPGNDASHKAALFRAFEKVGRPVRH